MSPDSGGPRYLCAGGARARAPTRGGRGGDRPMSGRPDAYESSTSADGAAIRESGAEVTVVGGGPCGLAAALAIARRGCSVRVLEAGQTVGGMAASPVIGGQRVDLGSHRLHPAAPEPVRALLDELLGDDLQVRRRNGRVHLDGRWIPFPFGPMELVRSLPPGFAASALRDVATRPLRRVRDDSYAEIVRAGLGPTMLERFHGPMATKLWGCDPRELAGELARRRIPVNGPAGIARALARSVRRGGRTFLYPRLGYGQLGERLAEAAVAAGVDVRTGAPVSGLRSIGGDTVELTVGDRLGGGEERMSTTGRVMWTAPLDVLVRAAGAPADVRARAERLEHRGLALVYLVVPRAQYHGTDAHYVPDLDVPFSRLSEPKNYRDGADPADQTVLCAEVPLTTGDDDWHAPDGELADRVLDGMARCGLEVPPVQAVEVLRLPRVYPVVTVHDPGARAALLTWADGLPGVTTLGRQGTFVADNVHHVLDMALGAAGCIGPDGTWDAAAWARERDRFDGFVVED
ncbi:MAG: FAD-dependent oxidoreductase [Ilumatobacteraceae bacterium]